MHRLHRPGHGLGTIVVSSQAGARCARMSTIPSPRHVSRVEPDKEDDVTDAMVIFKSSQRWGCMRPYASEQRSLISSLAGTSNRCVPLSGISRNAALPRRFPRTSSSINSLHSLETLSARTRRASDDASGSFIAGKTEKKERKTPPPPPPLSRSPSRRVLSFV